MRASEQLCVGGCILFRPPHIFRAIEGVKAELVW